MVLKPMLKVQQPTREGQQLQDNVAGPLDVLAKMEILQGRFIAAVDLTAGVDNAVNHGLGRLPKGWMVAGADAQATIWEVTATLPALNLVLRCSANVTVNLYVF